jgi:hypothetical protein
MMQAPRGLSSIAVVALAVTIFLSPPALAASTPCRSATDTAGLAVFSVKQMLAANGLDTTAVSLVNDSITCNAVINSYNTASDSSLRVVSGYVVQTDSNYVLFLPPATGTPYKTQVVVIFDRQFNLVVRMEGAG